jgi:predicted NAD/FAD-binding protein
MEFSVMCPNHGQVDVSIADISSVVVRDGDRVDVVFACPRCGTEIGVSARVPRMLLSTLEEAVVVDEATGEAHVRIQAMLSPEARVESVPLSAPDPEEQERIESYCEYFRRQLASTVTAEAMLGEIDGR